MNFKGVRTANSGPNGYGIAATEIPYGAFVTRSADGTIKAQVTNVPYNYLGVAVDDARKQIPYEGFYAAGKKVPYVKTGTARGWLLGGQTIDSGDFVRFPTTLGAGTEPLGVLFPESTAYVRTAYSVGRVVDVADSGNTDFDQTVSSISNDTLTIDSSANLTLLDLDEGDFIVIDSNEAAEVNMIVDPAASSTTCTCVKTPLASHANSIKIYKLTQIEVELI
jgi:hypothetical protein